MNSGVLTGLAVGFAVCWVLLVLCIRRSYHHRMLDERLNAPLLAGSNEHRLDAAIRGAEDGHKTCPVCGFENFKRFFFCNVCGEKLPQPRKRKLSASASASASASGSGDANKAVRSLGSVRLVRSRVDNEAFDPQLAEASAYSEISTTSAPAPRVFTRRQQRARRRREWQRKLGIDGAVFWFRDSSGESHARFPGHVLQFSGAQASETDAADSRAEEPTSDADGQYQHDDDLGRLSAMQLRLIALQARLDRGSGRRRENSEDRQSPPASANPIPIRDDNSSDTVADTIPHHVADSSNTVADTRPNNASDVVTSESLWAACTLQFDAAVATLKLELIDASSADASHLALGASNDDDVQLQWRDVLSHATQVFPAKYAHFVTATAALISTTESVTVVINRTQLLEDSVVGLATLPVASVRTSMRVHFEHEAGVDAGGLHREWFVLVCEQLAAPTCGVFRCTNTEEQSFYLNSNSLHDVGAHHLTYYHATGRLIGRALLEGDVLSFHLAYPLLKMILGMPVTFADLEFFDPELYKNLLWMIENDGVETLGLDFSVAEKRGDDIVTVDLIPNGRNIDVTDANKLEYLDRRFRYTLFESVSSQLFVFLKGLYEVIPQELLVIFDPEEFDYLLCGSDEIDVDDWEKHTHTTIGLRGHPALVWFWEIVREMPNEYRRRLLHFATGSSRVPIAGFSGLTSYDGRLCPFTLKGVRLVKDGYIWSHACFNRLDLPLHRDREQLKAVMYAAVETDLYGFTTL